MIDPETARQAAADVEAWQNYYKKCLDPPRFKQVIALAGLVPQLLDQLAEREEQLRLANIDACHEAVERDVLGERWVQLLEQLAKERAAHDLTIEERDAAARRAGALESEKAQLLDQLADVTGLARDYQEQRDILDRTVIRVAAERDALRTTLRSIANHKGSHGGLLIGLARAALGESEAKS